MLVGEEDEGCGWGIGVEAGGYGPSEGFVGEVGRGVVEDTNAGPDCAVPPGVSVLGVGGEVGGGIRVGGKAGGHAGLPWDTGTFEGVNDPAGCSGEVGGFVFALDGSQGIGCFGN
jgi:hypothetical protein